MYKRVGSVISFFRYADFPELFAPVSTATAPAPFGGTISVMSGVNARSVKRRGMVL